MLFALLAGAAMPAVVPAADKTPAAARKIVQRYYAALDARRYRSAYALWSDRGRASGQSYAQFVDGFARTAHTRVVAGQPTDGEGAAGSLFVTVPVTVTATLRNGVHQHYRGSYVLRRVNGVDGASPAQLHWHITSARLRPY